MIKDYFVLARPLNCAMSAIAVCIAAYIVAGNKIITYPLWLDSFLATVVVFLFTAAGNALNDYYDRFVDRVNHPERPLPAGRIKPVAAAYFSALLFGAALFLSVFINIDELRQPLLPLLVVTLCLALMVNYELFLKVRGLGGNVVIGLLTAALFIFGGVAMSSNLCELRPILIFAVMAFFATLGREIVKDIEDVKGDRERRFTLPMRIGKKYAGVKAAIAFGWAVAYSPLPCLKGLVGLSYLPAVLCADAIFIYCILVLFSNPGRASKLSKLGMAVALGAFVIGRLFP